MRPGVGRAGRRQALFRRGAVEDGLPLTGLSGLRSLSPHCHTCWRPAGMPPGAIRSLQHAGDALFISAGQTLHLYLTDMLFAAAAAWPDGIGRCRRLWSGACALPADPDASRTAGDPRPRNGELAAQRLGVNPDPWSEISEAVFQHRVPHQDVAVQAGQPQLALAAPVVVVRARAVVALTVGQGTADTDEEDGAPALWRCALAPLASDPGSGSATLRCGELDLGRQEGESARARRRPRALWP